MKPFIIFISFFAFLSTGSVAERLDSIDSVKKSATALRAHWRLTTRLHSQGIFNLGGRVGSLNPTFDVNFTYDRKNWGLLFFKGQDLYDHTTFYNFALLTVYKNIKLSDKVTVTPSIGSFLEQASGFADRGSDLVFLLTTAVKINQHLSVEHMSLFGNLVIEPNERDWVNRVRLVYAGKHLDVITSVWHNNQVFDHSSYWSAGINLAYSRVQVANHLFMSAGVSGLVMLNTTDESANPKKNSLMVTIGLQLVH